MKRQQSTMYPLGRNLFAYTKARKGAVKIHIRIHAVPSNVKGGRVVPTQRGVALDLKEFKRLIHIQKKLKKDCHQQMAVRSDCDFTPEHEVKEPGDSSDQQPPVPSYSPALAAPRLSTDPTDPFQVLQRPSSSYYFYQPPSTGYPETAEIG